MLAKSDLNQILNGVRKIVREEVVAEVQSAKDDMESSLSGWRMSIQTDIRTLGDRIKNLDIRVTRNHKELKVE